MKSGECLLIGDKHKTSAEEGVVCLQQRLAYDLEPMALAARHYEEPARRFDVDLSIGGVRKFASRWTLELDNKKGVSVRLDDKCRHCFQ